MGRRQVPRGQSLPAVEACRGCDGSGRDCTSPNVQSLPKGGGFRGCIRPAEGCVLVKADLSQIELWVLAAITEDENMLKVFGEGGDIHLATAEAVVGRKVEKGSPERQRAKALNFGRRDLSR